MKTLYDFKAKKVDGKEALLSEFKDKVVLIVNTASKCGLTPQYEGLEELYRKYKDKNFIILGFPCNQFGAQEKGTNSEIQQFCKINYGVTFPVFAKIDVNGTDEHPLYTWLKSQKGGFFGLNDIKWNFTKFLIGRNGNAVKRFSSTTKPEKLEKDIQKLLDN